MDQQRDFYQLGPVDQQEYVEKQGQVDQEGQLF